MCKPESALAHCVEIGEPHRLKLALIAASPGTRVHIKQSSESPGWLMNKLNSGARIAKEKLCTAILLNRLEQRQRPYYIGHIGRNDSSRLVLRLNSTLASPVTWEKRMFTLAVFAMGVLGGSLGVFSLIILETVVCGAVFFWSAGFVEACRNSVEAGAVLTAGFICTFVVLYLSDKFRFRPVTLRQRDESGLSGLAAGRELELIKVRLARFRTEPPK